MPVLGELPEVASRTQGASRVVFHADGVAYKVERDPDHGRCSNVAEDRNAKRHAGLTGVPVTDLYWVDGISVVAMPYFPHELAVTPDDHDPVYTKLEEHFGDVGAENVRRDSDGNLWLVDMATADDDHP